MSLINREALYEKACGLEAQALSYVGKIVNDETRTDEWRIWSAVLAERTAFKHDVFDAPEVLPEPKWIPCSERLPDKEGNYLMTAQPTYAHAKDIRIVHWSGRWIGYNKSEILAWMPLPEPYREEGEQE